MTLDQLGRTGSRLLVEGPDDLHSVVNLMKRHGVDYDNPADGMPYVYSCGGWTNVLETFPVALKTYRRLAILIDADFPPANRWEQVRARLLNAALDVPAALPQQGLVIPGILAGSSVGVWVMPDNQSPGMLETFLGHLVPSDDPRWDHACDSTAKAKAMGASFIDEHVAKAEIHTWLAWQETPGQPFGIAFTANCFNVDSDPALSFANWFRQAFPEC